MPPEGRTLGGYNGKTTTTTTADNDEDDENNNDVEALRMQLIVSSCEGSSFVETPNDIAPAESETTPKVLSVLAAVLDRLVARNEQLASAPSQQGKKLTIFHGLRAPNISIAKYLERIFKYTSCSPSCFVVGYVFLDRLIHRQPDLLVTSLNVHRLLVTSVLVATKMLDDVHFNNAFFAKVGGVSVLELNRLELEFLFRLDFKLGVTISVFESYCAYLERDISALEKKPEQRVVERSSPAFGSAAAPVCAPRTPRGSLPSTPQQISPKFKSKRPPPGPQVSFMSRNPTSLQYQNPLSHYFARDSPPSR